MSTTAELQSLALDRAGTDRLMNPRSVAIVGASDRPGSLGASVLTNLEQRGFSGEIHLVNPKRDEIDARPCVPDVSALPEGSDAAVLANPQPAVLDGLLVETMAPRRSRSSGAHPGGAVCDRARVACAMRSRPQSRVGAARR
ncbi:hypothetical protein SPHV1_700015 [Novosphingobium sp. KN65.2]|nr:hypothetical protein SPHV1_700015 [Novosphingobium sp. KN65.2]